MDLWDKITAATKGIASIAERKTRTAKMLRGEIMPSAIKACELVKEQFELFAELRPQMNPDEVDLDVMRPAALALRDQLNAYLAEIELREQQEAELAAPPPVPTQDVDGKKIVWN